MTINQNPPIHNIWAVARNYSLHARELGNAVPEQPVVFLKAGSCATYSDTIELPSWAVEIHHEIELALRFGPNLSISEIGMALDLTERKQQQTAKEKGLPWTLAKSFKNSCPVTPFILAPPLETLANIEIALEVNGQVRQKGNTSSMIFNIPTLVNYVLAHYPVIPGDLLLTGTPAGVGPILAGDQLLARLGNLIEFQWIVR